MQQQLVGVVLAFQFNQLKQVNLISPILDTAIFFGSRLLFTYAKLLVSFICC